MRCPGSTACLLIGRTLIRLRDIDSTSLSVCMPVVDIRQMRMNVDDGRMFVPVRVANAWFERPRRVVVVQVVVAVAVLVADSRMRVAVRVCFPHQ